MIAVIISHNQAEYIEQMLNALGGVRSIFVFDRCTDDSIETANRLCANYAVNLEGFGRQCGRARNIGAHSYPNDDILFLDADRIPNFEVSVLDNSRYDVTLVKSEIDVRDYPENERYVPYEKLWGTYHNGLFGSCVFVRRTALNKVLLKYGYLFDTDFTLWGEEDRHFGDLLYSVGATCGFIENEKYRVSGRGTMSYERKEEFQKMSALRVEKLFALGLDHLIRDPEISIS